jgi:hypothetical protein
MHQASLIILVTSMFCLPTLAVGQNCPSDSPEMHRFAEEVASSLPSVTRTELQHGRFVIKPIMQPLYTSVFTVSFISGRKVMFEKRVQKPGFISDDPSCVQYIDAVTEAGFSALYLSYTCGEGRISTGCNILVYPRMGAPRGSVSWQYKIEDDVGAGKRFRKPRRKTRRS